MAILRQSIGPPALLLFLIAILAWEGDYTVLTRLDFFSEPLAPAGLEH